MLNILSCVFWPSGCLFWKNVYSGFLPIYLFIISFAHFLKSLFTYFERDRDSMIWGGAEIEGERENPKQVPHCQHRGQRGAQTHITMRS